MSNAEDVPFEIRRADFFAVASAALGVLFAGLAGAPPLGGGSFGVPDVLNGVAGLLWFAIAGYYHFRPDSMNNGIDPAPRAWFEVIGLLIGLSALAVVIEVFLFSTL
ncbi:hypothetical protein BRC77_14845 [Halobacteriales archaeon QH_8_64_26]|jgi:uncharacterized RDD family membrane protein YckC|nr:MAG: hypothetical protein BRC77_14845 [Halobacteriales archaeon QH_8_64_26]